MPQIEYSVDLVDGVWKVGLNGRHFGPYSTLDTAITAASRAAHKAEAQGYEVILAVNTPPEAVPHPVSGTALKVEAGSVTPVYAIPLRHAVAS